MNTHARFESFCCSCLIVLLALAARGFAMDVDLIRVTDDPKEHPEQTRIYQFSENGVRDERYYITAQSWWDWERKRQTWSVNVTIRHPETVTSAESGKAIPMFFQRFFRDVPNAEVHYFECSLADDSTIWQELRPKMLVVLKDKHGLERLSDFPPEAKVALQKYEAASVPLRQFADDVAKLVDAQVERIWLHGDLGLTLAAPETFHKPWEELLKWPRLGVSEYDVRAHMVFKPRGSGIP